MRRDFRGDAPYMWACMKIFERLIDPFQPAKGPPPQTLWAFAKWALAGAGPALWLYVGLSVATGAKRTGPSARNFHSSSPVRVEYAATKS